MEINLGMSHLSLIYSFIYVLITATNTAGFGFSCQGRPSGYYADVATGCQNYFMCDDLGRRFNFACPNTTLFLQRMLVCDHWYMVNCSLSESDYNANLLIGQKDKHFVEDHEYRERTPRPDILTVPYSNNYYEGLKEAESKNPLLHENNDDHIDNYITTTKRTTHNRQTVRTTPKYDDFQIDIRMSDEDEDVDQSINSKAQAINPFFKKINSQPQTMTTSEIINVNHQLQGSNNVNNILSTTVDNRKINAYNKKTYPQTKNGIKEPSQYFELPKVGYSVPAQATEGPPVYYEWKSAAPSLDLQPPKLDSTINRSSDENHFLPVLPVNRTPGSVTLPPIVNSTREYDISTYLIPDYLFPLDKGHPGYTRDAKTSYLASGYQVNPACPECHPAYLRPGECEPCQQR